MLTGPVIDRHEDGFAGDGRCGLDLEDNGRGIPELRLHNLFDGTQSAQKGDSTRSMGIGLSVCKTVVAAHRGKIKGENIKGSGARFTVDLPLEEDEHEDQG